MPPPSHPDDLLTTLTASPTHLRDLRVLDSTNMQNSGDICTGEVLNPSVQNAFDTSLLIPFTVHPVKEIPLFYIEMGLGEYFRNISSNKLLAVIKLYYLKCSAFLFST